MPPGRGGGEVVKGQTFAKKGESNSECQSGSRYKGKLSGGKRSEGIEKNRAQKIKARSGP